MNPMILQNSDFLPMNKTGKKADASQNVMPIFVTSANHPWGAEHSMSTIIEGLSKLGAHSRVICSSQTVADFLNKTTDAEIILFKAPTNKFFRLLSFARHLVRHRKSCNVVVVFSVNLYFLGWLLRLLPTWRPRLVADVHDSFVSSRTLRMIAAAMAGYHRVIYISKYVGTMLPAVSDRRLVVRPISAVPASIPKQNTSSLVVGIAGRLDVEKRIELAIEAVGMSEPHVILHVYGDSFSDQDDYRATLVQLGEKLLPNRVRFMGTVPASHIYEEIDLLFVANSQEASGRTVGEAMAAGVPVVVPSRGGAQEFLEHMSSGLVYDADSALSASNAISLLAASQELRSQVRDGGRAKIQLERSPLHIAQLYLDALAD